MDSLVSVVVISYNSEKTIIDTLESIVKQTYKNIEIVITDDGSSDRTRDLIDKFDFKDVKHTLVFSDTNIGMAANANSGIAAAKGKYLKFIAADDILSEDAVEKYLSNVEKETIAVADFTTFGENEEKNKSVLDYYQEKYFFYNLNPQQQYKYLLANNIVCAPAVGLIEKDMIVSLGCYDTNYMFMEDYPFWIKCLENGYRFKLVPEVLVKYRVSDWSLSGEKKGKAFYCAKDFFWKERFVKLLKKGNVKDCIKNIFFYI